MRSKIVTTATIISIFLISTVAGIQVVEVAKANWIPIPTGIPPPLPPAISITSPEAKIYSQSNVSFSFVIEVSLRVDAQFRIWNETSQTLTNRTLQAPEDLAGIPFIAYSLDDKETVLENVTYPSVGLSSWSYSVNLANLSDGVHALVVNASGRQSAANITTTGISPFKPPIFMDQGTVFSEDVWSSSNITFTIDTTQPTITIITPQNTSYQPPILLIFNVNEPPSWMGYSLDNQANVTINGNTTLNGLSEFKHSIAIYANDSAGNMGKSETDFSNGAYQPGMPTPSPSPTQQPPSSPTSTPSDYYGGGVNALPLILGIIAFAVLLGVVGLVLLIKHRRLPR